MGHACGAKLSKTEFLHLQSGKPCPRTRCSDIAKELERDFPHMEPEDIYIRVGLRLKEIESKHKELDLRNVPSDKVTDVSRKDDWFSVLVNCSFSFATN